MQSYALFTGFYCYTVAKAAIAASMSISSITAKQKLFTLCFENFQFGVSFVILHAAGLLCANRRSLHGTDKDV